MKTNSTLEFDVILQQLSGYAVSRKAAEKLLQLGPFLRETQVGQKMEETTEAKRVIESFGTPPLSSMQELPKILELAAKGTMLTAGQLNQVKSFLFACGRMVRYLKKAEDLFVGLASLWQVFTDLGELHEEIDRCVRSERVEDEASTALRDIRRRIQNTETAVKAKLESILGKGKERFAEGYAVTRNGRLVLPVKKEYKNQVPGVVVDVSGTGSTCFIEPTAVGKLQEELASLRLQEENEIIRVLYTLTALVDTYLEPLNINMDCMETLDFAFAKAKLSLEMRAIPVPVTAGREMRIVAGRHPLLKRETCVPLDFEVGGETRGVIITGPNTGGKTVALKTVGLLSLMAQSGLHVPVGEGSVFCMHNEVLCDIGDGQSISENLSTFSAHVVNIIGILQRVTEESLVLLDELGSGTDPAEGMGLAIAILEELRQKNCLFLATTHYPEIKEFADRTQGLMNARMAFDKESLRPMYQLQIGEAGESCALYIAQRLGFPAHLLIRAQREAYGNKTAKKKEAPQLKLVGEATAPSVPAAGKIQREAAKGTAQRRCDRFRLGDSVMIYPQKRVGIVCRTADGKGMLTVQIQKQKLPVNHKRLQLISPAAEMYPEDYDFSIVFDSVENRKTRRQMDKGQTGLAITHEE